ncbi:MAG: signal peptidase II [Bacteroidetes bacterium]|nr:signal peptidase II [Bacteroidota bacterium]
MKKRTVVLIIAAIVLIDQALKFYVKLNFFAGEEHNVLGNWFRLHFLLCICLIYAGALGNLVDSMFYGFLFDSTYNPHNFQNANVVAHLLTGKGYGSFFQGKVVDMLYFPLFTSHFPTWFPIWGGERFEFFAPVFNIADASITCGVLAIFVFQGKFFKKHKESFIQKANNEAIANDVGSIEAAANE